MANYLSLEEAAAKLGIATERLVELRSQGQVRGFRDGASWKFPDTEIERLADDPDVLGSGVLDIGDPSQGDSNIIGGSDVGVGGETLKPGSSDSDVNLVASSGEGSDVAVVASDSDLDFESSEDLLEIDSGELQLQDPAIGRDPARLDLAVEPNAGSTGPVTDEELREISESHPDVLAPESTSTGGSSVLSLDSEDSDMDLMGADGSKGSSVVSSLEMMDDLNEPAALSGKAPAATCSANLTCSAPSKKEVD